MPFLRVIRDRRGFETTYLMDWYREGSRQRSRILYVFRTPSGVRVGRTPLEPEVRRDIQDHYPDLVFDWKAVLDTRQVIDAAPDPRKPQPRRRATEEDQAVAADSEDSANPPDPANRTARAPIPSSVEGSTPEERIAFLTHWYPIARERVEQRITDSAAREMLIALAERLNPEGWTSSDDIEAGVSQASDALEQLARVLTRRRRRPERGRPAVAGTSAPASEGSEPREGELPVEQVPDAVPSPGE